jgi:competence protein ComEA
VFDDRTRLFPWIAAALLVLAVGYRVMASRQPAPPPVSVEESAAAKPSRQGRGGRRLYVHVAGAVRRPGLYRLREGARVAAAIDLAGGLRRRADLSATNLAARVEDGQQVLVPVRGATPVAGAAAATPGAPAPAGATAAPISLGTATQAQLEELDGIGPTLAARIIEYRDANGGFRSVEELGEVSGIGEVRLEALRQAVQP